MCIITSSWGYLHDNLLTYVKNVQITSAVNMTLVLNRNQIQKKKKKERNIETDPVFPQLSVAIFPSRKYNTVELGGNRNEGHTGRYFICI